MTRTRGRLGASTGAFAWFLGLYALPLVHNLDHRDDHTHGPTAVADHYHDHEQDDEEEHSHPVPLDSDHGTGSVLHFAAASLGALAVELPSIGPRIALPPPPGPLPAPSPPLKIVLVRGPPAVDSL
jgi:hypothetical protein